MERKCLGNRYLVGTETFYRDLSTVPWDFCPRWEKRGTLQEMTLRKDRSVILYQAFPAPLQVHKVSMDSLDIPIDREECFISKHNTVLTWVNSIGNTSYFKL